MKPNVARKRPGKKGWVFPKCPHGFIGRLWSCTVQNQRRYMVRCDMMLSCNCHIATGWYDSRDAAEAVWAALTVLTR